MEELLSTATIGRTHGVEGFLRVYSLSGEYAHLKKLKSAVAVFPDGREKLLSVLQVRTQGDNLLMKFSGYETPESARLLSGAVLKVKREDARKLKKGEYYIADLYNLSVIYNGEAIGVIRSVSEGAQAMLLNVERNGKIYLVPNLPVFVSRPDFEKGTIELLMGELVDL
ncbi:MAG: 16S rRNA processing protein RimM [Spirochaetes bacterium]|uniref:Ribosome maturation factor RimM n=1 Tax=Candidatus Ornithospirochaeta stercoripullorum TaxID=2840899 RepID=A0A9D9DZ65_9SPIO|nr:16S rRNA processing protein RimM [Candidatus Ornithospirochaeta stercoripullorum]